LLFTQYDNFSKGLRGRTVSFKIKVFHILVQAVSSTSKIKVFLKTMTIQTMAEISITVFYLQFKVTEKKRTSTGSLAQELNHQTA